jgi:hypothetical protein
MKPQRFAILLVVVVVSCGPPDSAEESLDTAAPVMNAPQPLPFGLTGDTSAMSARPISDTATRDTARGRSAPRR